MSDSSEGSTLDSTFKESLVAAYSPKIREEYPSYEGIFVFRSLKETITRSDAGAYIRTHGALSEFDGEPDFTLGVPIKMKHQFGGLESYIQSRRELLNAAMEIPLRLMAVEATIYAADAIAGELLKRQGVIPDVIRLEDLFPRESHELGVLRALTSKMTGGFEMPAEEQMKSYITWALKAGMYSDYESLHDAATTVADFAKQFSHLDVGGKMSSTYIHNIPQLLSMTVPRKRDALHGSATLHGASYKFDVNGSFHYSDNTRALPGYGIFHPVTLYVEVKSPLAPYAKRLCEALSARHITEDVSSIRWGDHVATVEHFRNAFR